MNAINHVKRLFSFRPLNLFERVGARNLPLFFTVPVVFMMLGGWLVASLAAIVFVLFGVYAFSRYRDSLELRARAPDGPEWEVKVNQVKVGNISDADYAAIRLAVFSDWNLYWLQAKNALRVMLKILDFVFGAFPKVVFWVIVFFALCAPEAIEALIAATQHATAIQIERTVETAGVMVLAAVMLSALVEMVSGRALFGFANQFDEAIRSKLRVHFSLVADGSFVLFRESSVEAIIYHDKPLHENSLDGIPQHSVPISSVAAGATSNDK